MWYYNVLLQICKCSGVSSQVSLSHGKCSTTKKINCFPNVNVFKWKEASLSLYVVAVVWSVSCVWLLKPHATVACRVPLSIVSPKQEYWIGLPFPPAGDLPDPGTEPGSPAMRAYSLLFEPPGKPRTEWPNNGNSHSTLFSLAIVLFLDQHFTSPGSLMVPRPKRS